jgi:hypothetical protein
MFHIKCSTEGGKTSNLSFPGIGKGEGKGEGEKRGGVNVEKRKKKGRSWEREGCNVNSSPIDVSPNICS